ncbi:MAG: flagellar motor protein MotB [Spirochaetes bacterium]|nr:flagellar motor protein MotB [Spirochaetota bacterium]
MVKREKKPVKGAPGWMVSWSDMTTLLLTFFILMFNMNDISGKDFFLILSSFRGALGMFEGGSSLSKGRLEELGMSMMNLPAQEKGRSLAKSLKKAMEIFKPEIQAKKVRVKEDERGLVISLSGDAYFAPGSARLQPGTREVLKKIAGIIRILPNFVRIEGHTDSSPIPVQGVREGYETNWELSSGRSVNVVRYLSEVESVNPKKMSSAAYNQYRPIDDNSIPEGRAYNRRVDIVILKEKIISKDKLEGKKEILPDEEWL